MEISNYMEKSYTRPPWCCDNERKTLLKHLSKRQLPHSICIDTYPDENLVANTLWNDFKPAGLSQPMTDVWVEAAERATSSDLYGSAKGNGKSVGCPGRQGEHNTWKSAALV